MTKPLTTPTTNPAQTAPLASQSQRSKFTFTISNKALNKGNKPDLSKTKQDRNKLGEKDENIGMQAKLSSSTDVNAPSEIKSPIASSDKRTDTVTQSESSQSPAKIDGSSVNEKCHFSQKEKTKMSSEESTPSKKEEKGKVISSSKKPRPPPLFIPRAVVQGKGTPQSTRKSLQLLIALFRFHCLADVGIQE